MRRPARRDQAGAIAIVVAVSSVLLFVLAALVVDLGLARDVRRQSQNAADASALAAANVLYPTGPCLALNPSGTLTPPCFTDAINAAKAYADDNFGVDASDWNSCTDANHFWAPAGGTQCISFTDDTLTTNQPTNPTKVRVLAPIRTVDTPLGAVAGVDHVDVASVARATIEQTTSVTCALCFLGDVTARNADFTVEGGGIMVNGDISVSSFNSVWDADAVGVVGTVSGGPTFPPDMPEAADPFGDPWASRTDVPPAVPAGHQVRTNPCTQGPGIYGDVNLPNGACDLTAGLYVITGTWGAKNNTTLTGTGVTLYATCGTTTVLDVCDSPGEAGGMLDFKNGTVALTAPTGGATAGIAIFYDKWNTQDLTLQGNGDTGDTGGACNGDVPNSDISGAVYVPSGKLAFNGNSCFVFAHGPVIAGTVDAANGTKSGVVVKDADSVEVAKKPGAVSLDR